MTSFEIEQIVTEMIAEYNALKSRNLHDFDMPYEAYVRVFNRIPKVYSFSNAIDYDKTIEKFQNAFDCYFTNYSIDYHVNSDGDLEEERCYGNCLIFAEDKQGNKVPNTIISLSSNFASICTSGSFEDFREYIVLDTDTPPCEVFWVTKGNSNFVSKRLTVDIATFDIKSHYNDDFNYQKVADFVDGDKAGMVIFYGEPGTGKTYLIKQLALTHPDKRFYFMDQNTFAYIMDPSFIDFLNGAEDSVFVLEDCEELLTDRDALMSTILNLTDGVLGDSMKIKFICTFNASLNNIDKALLRKGRLKYKYEFKKLSAKKTEELAIALNKDIPEGKELTVCDIYNWDEDNNVQESRSHIGFGH